MVRRAGSAGSNTKNKKNTKVITPNRTKKELASFFNKY
jgi:hypothetical protein